MSQTPQFGTPIKRDYGEPLTAEQLGLDPGGWQVSQQVIDEARRIDEQQAVSAVNCKLLMD